MVKVFFEDDELHVKGTFDFGYVGMFRDDMIYLGDAVDDDVLEEREGDDWDEAAERFGIEDTTDEAICEALTGYLNDLEAKVQANIREINNNLIAVIAEMWENTSNPFWEDNDELFIPEGMEKFNEIKDTEEFDDAVSAIVNDYIEQPNNGTMDKVDAEAEMRRLFPMFDWDKFLANMKPKSMGPSFGEGAHFEIDDGFGARIFCSAVATLDDELRFSDWDNF